MVTKIKLILEIKIKQFLKMNTSFLKHFKRFLSNNSQSKIVFTLLNRCGSGRNKDNIGDVGRFCHSTH